MAALSWAATQIPEITVASQSFLKTGLLSAVQVEPLVIIEDEFLHLGTNGFWLSEFRDFCEILQFPRNASLELLFQRG
jgi:hypothetical protein